MEHLINLNFAPGGLPATVHVSQYDDTIRQLRFQLWFGRSKVEVPSGASVRVDIKKPDGHIVLVNGTVNSSDRSIVTVPTTKQMTAAPGGARGTLVVSSTGDKRISSAIFILHVHRDPVEDGDASDSDLSMLQDAIDQTAANASAAQAAATAAQEAASSFTTDTTLSVSGKAADAKKTGDELTAIKADLADANESLRTYFKNPIHDLEWRMGLVRSLDGSPKDSTNRICTGYIPAPLIDSIHIADGSKYAIFVYSGLTWDTYEGAYENMIWRTEDIEGLSLANKYIRLVAASADDADITEEYCSNISVFGRTDTSLSVYGKPADSKTVGDTLRDFINAKYRISFDVKKGSWSRYGKILTNNVKAICIDRILDLAPGTLLYFYLSQGWTYTIREGDTKDSLPVVTYHIETFAKVVTTHQYIAINFNKFEDGESVNLTVEDFDFDVAIFTLGYAKSAKSTVEVHDLPTSQGQLNAVFRAYQLSKIEYMPTAVLPLHSGGTINVTPADANPNVKLSGIPYSSMRETMAYVPQSVSLKAFMTMVENPNSYLYTRHYEGTAPNYSYNSRCFVGAVCSSFVAYCYGIEDVILTTISFDDYPGFEKLSSDKQNPYSLKLANALIKSGNHICIITDIIRNERGRISKIEIAEAWKPRCRIMTYTPQQIQSNYFNNGYEAYEYTNINGVTYEVSPWVHVDNTESDNPTMNAYLSPRKGEDSNWAIGETVEIDVLDAKTYNEYAVFERTMNRLISVDTIPDSNLIQLIGLVEGKYAIYLKKNSTYSEAVNFDVINAQPTYSYSADNHLVRVSFESAANRTPSAIYWCCNQIGDSDYKGVRAFHILTQQEITQGWADVEEPQGMHAGNTTNDAWLMRMTYKTEYGLFASELEQVTVV